VRRQGLFDDPTDEINSLIFRIKEDLASLNGKCDAAQSYVDDQKRMLGAQNQAANYSLNVVGQLRSELMSTTKDFKSILEMRSSKMKDNQDRKVKLTGNAVLSPMRQLTASAEHSREMHLQSGKASFYNPYLVAESANLLETGGRGLAPEQQLLLAPPNATQQYYEAREVAVNEVEKTIGELGQIFQRLASMISEQQSLVERVDEDVEAAVSNADRARELLLKTYENVSSNRALYTKVFAILFLFIIFFILFLL
jgi:syntaxin 5